MPKYLQLEAALARLGIDDVEGTVGRVSSYEVVVDGFLVFSKISKGAFPDFKSLANQVHTFRQTVDCVTPNIQGIHATFMSHTL